MQLSILDKEQVKIIYNERMKEDFPPDELKPLAMIYKAMDANIYFCYGLTEADEILGYIFLVKQKETEDYLIDYIAIDKRKRNQGLGAILIKELGDLLKDADSVIGEVENPALATEKEQHVLQKRRYDFYMRNGLIDTEVYVTCFGVPFIILEVDCGKKHSKEEIKLLYQAHYQLLLPREMYEKNIRV